MFVYLGADPISIQGNFVGTIVAPAARLEVHNGDYFGAFFAKDLVLRPNARVLHRPFMSWDDVSGDGGNRTPPPDLPVIPSGPPPPLAGSGEAARTSVRQFVDWVMGASLSDRPSARTIIHSASGNVEIAAALIEEFNAARTQDGARGIMVLAILGQLRNPIGEAFLTGLLREPLPGPEPVTEHGREMGRFAYQVYSSTAIRSLAHMRSTSSRAEVLRVAVEHPDRSVRVEAIRAFLFQEGPRGRADLEAVVRSEELIMLDRVESVASNDGTTYGERLAAFLQAHPEAIPPPPEAP